MNAYQDLMTALATRRPDQSAADDERIVQAALAKRAHELAAKIRAEKGTTSLESGHHFFSGMDYAADLIDPDASAGPASTDEESDVDGGHDFQWGDDHVQRCTRCTLPHSRWAGGPCPGPDNPLPPGVYV